MDSWISLPIFPFRILDSCTGLMKAIRELILKSKDLQDEIVADGRVRKFYDASDGGKSFI